MKKIIFVIFCFLFLLAARPIFADTGFGASADITYKFNVDGSATITQEVTLENLQTNLYAQSFNVNIKNSNPLNPRAYEGNMELPLELTKTESETRLHVTFKNAIVGVGNKRKFSIVFEDTSLAVKNGEIWEISIPKLDSSSGYESYNVAVYIPNEFGKESFMSPPPIDKNETSNSKIFYYNRETIEKNGVTGAFGNFQVFKFSFTYHLENPLITNAQMEIALPPDTSFQKVNLGKLDPLPKNIRVDSDGNWLALYNLSSKQRFDVTATGSVQIFASPIKKIEENITSLAQNLKASTYWQTNDPKIISLAQKLTNPRDIYDFVTKTLVYDTSRAVPNVVRYGAVKALENSKNAICMEFSDLFIAIARAKGIPAREINGYAYTENPQIQPLSLVSDVLHSWVEYWDSEKQVWIPIDPTWGSTTGGVDYFSKLDLRHFTFVIHGADPIKPYPPGSYKLGPNPQKDVFVSFSNSVDNPVAIPQLSSESISLIPFTQIKITGIVKNVGTGSLYDQKIEVYFDGEHRQDVLGSAIPPLGSYEIPITIPYSFLGKDTPNKVSLVLGNQKKDISTNKAVIIVENLSVLLFVIFSVALIIFIKFKMK